MKCLLYFIAFIALCYSSVNPSPVKLGTYTGNEENDQNYIPDDILDYTNLGSKVSQDVSVTSSNSNEYWLFTRKNPTTPQIIVDGDINTVLNSNYDANKPLKVIAHGWNRYGGAASNTIVTSAYLDTSDVNVIVLDWSVAASGDYFSASSRVPATGRALGNFLQWLITNGGGDWNRVHLIGYSLGAHLMGNAGQLLGGRPKRVTGLDPAGPFWSANPFAINTQAGQYVEIIHTNILVRGITEPIGHADFYPNGGLVQPGCDNDHVCAHARSYQFFASSVRTDHFIGRQCSNLLQAMINVCHGSNFNMGNGILDKNGRGIYALSTGSSWPF